MGHPDNPGNEEAIPLGTESSGQNKLRVDEAREGCAERLTSAMTEACSPQQLKKRLPALTWLPSYTLDTLVKDFIAGLTVGLTAIPQGIAYAVVAGLQPQYGLYSGFMGCFVYMLMGTCKDITIGPTAIMALMTQKYVERLGPDFAVLLSFLAGIIIALLGVFRLGFLVEFISMPVTAGFTSAAAITIASSQVKALLGLSGNSHGFIDSWKNVFAQISKIRLWDTVLGIGTIVLLYLLKKLKEKSDGWKNESGLQLALKRTAWLTGLGRNAVVVILGTLLAFILSSYDQEPFKLTGNVDSGLPPFEIPPFSTTVGNRTLTFVDMASELGSAFIVIPLIAILESIAIAKAFAKGKSIDATQEMLALGACNIVGSFVRSFPTTGSFTRTAVNNASGVVTPFGGVFTGILVLLSLSFLTSTFYFIPKATLAGVIVSAMFYMVEYHIIGILWRTKKLDILPFLATLITCLFLGLEYGMAVGIAVNLLFILYNSARPSVDFQWIRVCETEVLLVIPNQSLVFPASDYIRDTILEACLKKESSCPVVLDGTHICSIDSTMAKGIKLLGLDLEARGQSLYLWKWKKSAMHTVIGFDQSLGQMFRYEETLEDVLHKPANGAQKEYSVLPVSEDESPRPPLS